jgi:Transglycosylase SLT domain
VELLRPLALILAALGLAVSTRPQEPEYFVPAHRLAGIGAGRQELSETALAERTEAMIQSQTFSIMREPQALAGARRIYGSGLQRLFRNAARRSGFPAATLQAIAYLESWGNPKAESPAGPRGIMQISVATARRMGLRISYAVRHRTTKTRTVVRNKHGRLVHRTVRHRIAYSVLVRDDRLRPERAIPAAARYLAEMEQHFGGRDWAIWAYHCGEGCVADFQAMARQARGLGSSPSVARVFFGCNPVWNRELCQAIRSQMDRDYSPTYWFRVMRAQQLLRMYMDDPPEFQDLVAEYRYRADGAQRAPDRLSVWVKPSDLIYQTPEAIRRERRLVAAPDAPGFFGFRLTAAAGMEPASFSEEQNGRASPAAIGTLAYIAFETRRLWDAMGLGEAFVPIDVTAMVLPVNGGVPDREASNARLEHSSGQVFDISLARLPGGEKQCLRFVLDDLGWNGYLGFIEDPPGSQTLHIGCSPSSRPFFTQVFEDVQAAWKGRMAPLTPASSAQRP